MTVKALRTDEVVESEERARELVVIFHDNPNSRANTSVNELYVKR